MLQNLGLGLSVGRFLYLFFMWTKAHHIYQLSYFLNSSYWYSLFTQSRLIGTMSQGSHSHDTSNHDTSPRERVALVLRLVTWPHHHLGKWELLTSYPEKGKRSFHPNFRITTSRHFISFQELSLVKLHIYARTDKTHAAQKPGRHQESLLFLSQYRAHEHQFDSRVRGWQWIWQGSHVIWSLHFWIKNHTQLSRLTLHQR